MTSTEERTGSCLCGAVNITIKIDATDLGVCHCHVCRRWAGGPFMEIECDSGVSFGGEENISVYSSSSWAERGFCRHCGSHLFVKEKDNNHYGIPPGLFDSTQDLKLTRQVFFDRKPNYYAFADNTRNISSEYIYRHHPHLQEHRD